MKASRPLTVYTSDPTNEQMLAWVRQQQTPGLPVVVRPLHQLDTVTISPAAPVPKSL